MNNRLPEKLITLRKYFGFSQADIAARLNVSVAEYMSWENGKMICRIDQLRALASLFGVPLVQLLDNTKEARLPRKDAIYDSVQIPFQNLNRPASEATLEEDMADNILPIAAVQPQPEPAVTEQDLLYTAPVSTAPVSQNTIDADLAPAAKTETLQFDNTVVNEIRDDDPEEEEEEEEGGGLRNKLMLVLAAAAVLLLFFSVRALLKDRDESDPDSGIKVAITDVNRLALGRTFSAYIKDDGTVVSMGNLDISGYTDLVQVSAANSWLAGLKSDGSVIIAGTSNYSTAKSWKNIRMIAAADTHIAGVNSDGTVSCTGNTGACEVSSWENIRSVYAGSGYTIGQKKNGGLVVSGNLSCASELESLSDVKSLTVGDSQITVVDSNGRVTCYSTGSSAPSNTASWSGIRYAASGSNFAAGLTSEGKIVTATTDDTLSRAAAALNDIRFIAARGGTLVAADSAGNIVGAGDNTNKVYGAQPSATPEASKKLDQVKNVKFSVKTDNLTITWDTVIGAKYYMVKVNTSPETSLRSAKNSASISAKNLTDGKIYSISITACGDEEEENSEPTVVEYQYNEAAKKLDAPKNLKAAAEKDKWNLSWDKVDRAVEYIITIDTSPVTELTSETNKVSVPAAGLVAGKVYTVKVIASDGKEKNNSSPLTASFEYRPAVVRLDTPKNIEAAVVGNKWIITWDPVENAAGYTVKVGDDAQALLVTTARAEYAGSLEDGKEYEIFVTAVAGNESDRYEDSETGKAKIVYSEPEYTVTVQFGGVQDDIFELKLKKGTYTFRDYFTSYVQEGNELAEPGKTFQVNGDTTVSVWINEIPHTEPEPEETDEPEPSGDDEPIELPEQG